MALDLDPRAPCLIGVARHTWHPGDVGDDGAPEPLAMWEELARAAADDAGAPRAVSELESLQIVYCQSWQYDDAPGRLADRLGADPKHRLYSGIGGTTPQVLVSDAAQSIMRGDLDLGLVVGAEALATIRRLKKDGRKPQWSYKPEERRAFPFDIPFHPAEVANGIFEAFLTFALFDNARRAHLGRTLDDHRGELGRLLAPLSAIAARHPADAWFPIARSAAEIVEPTPDNRMVAYPYTKLMVSIMDVDMAAALLVASRAKADELGVPEDQRVYLRGWAYAQDPYYVAERRDLWRSEAMAVAARATLDSARVGSDDVSHFDLYSCFASSLDFATDALGVDHEPFLSGERSLTVTGALPYHGGPGSNYMTHSLAAMAQVLRQDPGSLGLVSGVGMHMTKHVYGLWSSTPGTLSPPDGPVLADQVRANQPVVALAERAEGDATVATYSVLHGRDAAAEWAALVCDLPGEARCYARLEGKDALARAERNELIGTRVRLSTGDDNVTTAQL
jgi:acetyl-CoA C-acetyltransferase